MKSVHYAAITQGTVKQYAGSAKRSTTLLETARVLRRNTSSEKVINLTMLKNLQRPMKMTRAMPR